MQLRGSQFCKKLAPVKLEFSEWELKIALLFQRKMGKAAILQAFVSMRCMQMFYRL